MTGASPSRTWTAEQDAQLLGLDSGTVAFADFGGACDLVRWARFEPAPAAATWPVWTVGRSVLCASGCDGLFPFVARGSDEACDELEVWFDEPTADPLAWTAAGVIDAASGLLMVADPYLLDQYTVEDYDGPVFAAGLWIELRLPGPGDVHVEIGRPPGAGRRTVPTVVRARWHPPGE